MNELHEDDSNVKRGYKVVKQVQLMCFIMITPQLVSWTASDLFPLHQKGHFICMYRGIVLITYYTFLHQE